MPPATRCYGSPQRSTQDTGGSMPLDAADATTGQLVFLIICYGVAGIWCAVLAVVGTRSWTTYTSRVLGAIAATLAISYAIYLTVALVRGAGFLPVGFLGLLVPIGMILNAYRHDLLGRRRGRGRARR